MDDYVEAVETIARKVKAPIESVDVTALAVDVVNADGEYPPGVDAAAAGLFSGLGSAEFYEGLLCGLVAARVVLLPPTPDDEYVSPRETLFAAAAERAGRLLLERKSREG